MEITAKHIIKTDKAPGAIGPYSQAVRTDSLVFTSGQIALHPQTGQLVDTDIQTETRQVLTNLKHVLAAAGSSLEHVVKTTVFIKNMDDFPKINEVYAEFFPSDAPARSCVEVARIPRDCHVEIEAIALLAD